MLEPIFGNRTATALAALSVANLVMGQRLPDPDDPGLLIDCHRLQPIVDQWTATGYGNGLEIPVQRLGLFARKFVEPALGAGEDARVLGDRMLIVRARPEQQAWVSRWLERIATHPPQVVQVSVSFFTVPTEDFEQECVRLLASTAADEPAVPGILTVSHSAVLPAAATDAMTAALDKRGNWKIDSTPRLLLNEFQKATMSTTETTSYVAGFQPAGTKDQQVFSPEVGKVDTGSSIDVAATVLPDGAIGVRLVADHRAILSMAQKPWSPHHPDLVIKVPEVLHRQVDTWDRVPAEHTALYAIPAKAAGDVLLVALRASAVAAPR